MSSFLTIVAIWVSFSIMRLPYDGRNLFRDIWWTFWTFMFAPPDLPGLVFDQWGPGESNDNAILSCIVRHRTLFYRGSIAILLLSNLGLPRLEKLKTIWKSTEPCTHGEVKEPFRPLFFPARTTHTRFFPKKHSFSYSYLLVGVPVGWCGQVGRSFLGVNHVPPLLHQNHLDIFGSVGLFSVDAEDYLQRGLSVGLQQKLEQYLETQGKSLRNYASAYLVTAPKFLGYAFNPVSFWYLYDERRYLRAMILEVNNTFDERRMYFLEKGAISPQKQLSFEDGVELKNESNTLSASWPKDFHVSPFNSRKGSYALTAHDPFGISDAPKISNTITLLSSKDHSKLVARIVSTSKAIDPSKLSVIGKIRFVLCWCWVGFVTFPRIVREATKLFFKRKLHVWYRPEILPGSIPRNMTREERIIENVFRRWLSAIMGDTKGDLLLKYKSSEPVLVHERDDNGCINPKLKHSFYLSSRREEKADHIKDPKIVDLEIVSPQFYTSIVLATDLQLFFKALLGNVEPSAQLVRCSDPDFFLSQLHHSRANTNLQPFFHGDNYSSSETCKEAVLRIYVSEKVFHGVPVPLLTWFEWGIRCALYILAGWASRTVLYLYLLKIDDGHQNGLMTWWIPVLKWTTESKMTYGSLALDGYHEINALYIIKLTAMLCGLHIWWALGSLARYSIVG